MCYRERVGRWIRGCVFTIRQTYRTKHILKSSYLNRCGLFFVGDFMAIQTINLTVPGGDTPRSANTKINENFSNTTHAASRLVGLSYGNVVQVNDIDKVLWGLPRSNTIATTLNNDQYGNSFAQDGSTIGAPPQSYTNIINMKGYAESAVQIALPYNDPSHNLYIRSKINGQEWTGSSSKPWAKIYHSQNTTIGSNGAIVPSSPVLKIYADHMDAGHEGALMGVIYTKNGVGDYTISNTTGLRNDGWYIILPNDMNGNPKVAVTLEEVDGVISLKSYKRIFSMETFTFVPDLEQPLDIPDTRWIDLRLNEISAEENL